MKKTPPTTTAASLLERLKATPLYIQIFIALILGVTVGVLFNDPQYKDLLNGLAIFPNLILKVLKALAPPLILVAVLHAFLTAEIPARTAPRLLFLLLSNTVAAIVIGLLVANTVQPGLHSQLTAPLSGVRATDKVFDPLGLIESSIPATIVQPLAENNVLQVVVVAITFGLALRAVKTQQQQQGKRDYLPLEQAISTLFELVIRVLGWVVTLVPFAVFGVVARVVGLQGFAPFKALGFFVVAVLLALFLQGCFYLTRVGLQSWVKPLDFLKGGSDAFSTAFSTASSTITMPVTFRALTDKIRLRESSASLGALVGSNFNNDGTALYEAMSALFIAQLLNQNLHLEQQLLVVLTSIVASVGAAGIPEAGLVTMTLVFTAVGLPVEYIVLLVTVDWFLDRCRTTINVMGDMTVAAVLDGKQPGSKEPLVTGA
ncbi:dicarboxylate/amino acid:cation symporter [Anthocerotibacter panamensis]|uniref:dicarboxylate/amino acid:cation symporter n=1 Tax=Anthocerotibacter panamensis TaxID=2857077 RepID=UPI001C406AF3|nr:dicarboxylate/amino acid:cation symporter [Anthocerotibacter panamensis]